MIGAIRAEQAERSERNGANRSDTKQTEGEISEYRKAGRSVAE